MEKNTDTLPNVKILVAYHTPSTLLKDSVLTPIHVGRELALQASKNGAHSEEDLAWMIENTIGDNTGDNISGKNERYCELTSTYWAWKNYHVLGDPDYIGFMHYRRHLCFNLEEKSVPNQHGMIHWPQIDNDYINTFHLRGEQIRDVVKDYDVIMAEKLHVGNIGAKSVYDQYRISPYHQIRDYEIASDVIKELYPEYSQSVDEYNSQPYAYFTNIFIMRKKMFMDYAEWLFSIIEETGRRVDVSQRTTQRGRALAYISERLFGIWFTYAQKTSQIKALELKRTLIVDTSYNIRPVVYPAFKENNVAICCPSSLQYLPYLATAIRSIIVHSDKGKNYDINILHSSIPDSVQREVKDMQGENIRIRFWNIASLVDEWKDKMSDRAHWTRETYYCYFVPTIFHRYKKVLVMDCDIVVRRDVALLYETELKDKEWVGAAHDAFIRCRVYMGEMYFRNKLKLRKPANYFQAGVLLFNIPVLTANRLLENAFSVNEKFGSGALWFADQDVLNILCEGHVKFVDIRWNVEWNLPICIAEDYKKYFSDSERDTYETAYNDPWILHYCGPEKPWRQPYQPQSYYFWEYARKTAFYEDILYENLRVNPVENITRHIDQVKDMAIVKDIANYKKNRRIYYRNKILAILTYGKRHQFYTRKKKEIKEKIKRVQRFLRNHG